LSAVVGRYVAQQLVITTLVGELGALVAGRVGQDVPEDVVEPTAVWRLPRHGCWCVGAAGRPSPGVLGRHTEVGFVNHDESKAAWTGVQPLVS